MADTSIRRSLVVSGEFRVWVSSRTDLVTGLSGVWFGVGPMVDAWVHTNLSELATFFTAWHALLYSG
ncbi:hypothetical protein GCM10022224_003550 [Nonomuraea antimicrobica]|uniref:Uncharacterized protein n=1 Tax=Nonomuraea antimicrobica TaxID=561173 RepID=A0ABP7AZE3_9ACTN